eukprot:2275019-Pyramimonas_sp.AAC.1
MVLGGLLLAWLAVHPVLGGKKKGEFGTSSKGNQGAWDATQAFLRARQSRLNGERAPGEPDSDGY